MNYVYQRTPNTKWKSIVKGVSLTPLEQAHKSELFRIIEENRSFLEALIYWIPYIQSETDCSHMIRLCEAEREAQTRFVNGIFYENKLCGVAEIKIIDPHHRSAAFGMWLSKNLVHKGLGPASAMTMIRFAFNDLKINRVEMRCAIDNLASRYGILNCGAKFEGIARGSELIRGRFVDNEVYSVLAEEFDFDF